LPREQAAGGFIAQSLGLHGDQFPHLVCDLPIVLLYASGAAELMIRVYINSGSFLRFGMY